MIRSLQAQTLPPRPSRAHEPTDDGNATPRSSISDHRLANNVETKKSSDLQAKRLRLLYQKDWVGLQPRELQSPAPRTATLHGNIGKRRKLERHLYERQPEIDERTHVPSIRGGLLRQGVGGPASSLPSSNVEVRIGEEALLSQIWEDPSKKCFVETDNGHEEDVSSPLEDEQPTRSIDQGSRSPQNVIENLSVRSPSQSRLSISSNGVLDGFLDPPNPQPQIHKESDATIMDDLHRINRPLHRATSEEPKKSESELLAGSTGRYGRLTFPTSPPIQPTPFEAQSRIAVAGSNDGQQSPAASQVELFQGHNLSPNTQDEMLWKELMNIAEDKNASKANANPVTKNEFRASFRKRPFMQDRRAPEPYEGSSKHCKYRQPCGKSCAHHNSKESRNPPISITRKEDSSPDRADPLSPFLQQNTNPKQQRPIPCDDEAMWRAFIFGAPTPTSPPDAEHVAPIEKTQKLKNPTSSAESLRAHASTSSTISPTGPAYVRDDESLSLLSTRPASSLRSEKATKFSGSPPQKATREAKASASSLDAHVGGPASPGTQTSSPDPLAIADPNYDVRRRGRFIL